MSEQKTPQTQKVGQPTKKLEVGKFYFIHDGSKTGHPGLIIKANNEENRYLVIRFDSDKFGEISKINKGIRHITKLKFPTSNLVAASYVHNRPMLCKRKDIGKELMDLSISTEDTQTINIISLKDPEYSPSLRKSK